MIKTQINLLLSSLLFFVYTSVFSQDLIVNSLISQNPSGFTLHKGELINFSFQVRNQGTANTNSSKVQFYLGQNPTGVNSFPIAVINVKPLTANQSSETTAFQYIVPENLTIGTYYLFSKVDPFNSVTETVETNNYLVYSTMPLNYSSSQPQIKRSLAYPMIIIHGLNSSAETWDSFATFFQKNHGFQFGGQFNFCLNQDNDLTTGTMADVFDHSDYASLTNGDYYFLNFDVNTDGSVYGNTVQSNQSAIAKQGEALRRVVDSVLSLTGAEKVHLLGHSMGGLCSRDFIQKYDLDADKTAKLTTLFTPHGGSNSTAYGLGFLAGLYEGSEAIRDLRYSYTTDYHGVYLFGGYEDDSYIDHTFFDYDNVDVNANGQIGNFLMGINNMPIPSEEKMDFSVVIGDGALLGGDGVVAADRANIMNFVDIQADTFVIQQPSYYSFTDVLHNQALVDSNSFSVFMQALDETDVPELAWKIEVNTLYTARIDKKGGGEVYSNQGAFDYDYFKLNIDKKGTLTIKVSNIPIGDFRILLYDENLQLVQSLSSLEKGSLNLSQMIVEAGEYFIRFQAITDDFVYQNSYFFEAEFEADFTSLANEDESKFELYPNPASDVLFVKGSEQESSFEIYTMDGRLILQENYLSQNGIDLHSIENGKYLLKIKNSNQVFTFIKI